MNVFNKRIFVKSAFLPADSGMDGVNQWDMVSSGASSARPEFVYNIDEIEKNAAIRYRGPLEIISFVVFK